jgi:hypothetical protein
MDELKAEINRINADVYGQTTGVQPGVGVRPGVVIPSGGGGGHEPLASFAGTVKFNNQDVGVWQTSQGLIMLPAVTPIAVDPTSDPRVQRAGGIAQLVHDNQDVVHAFPGAVTKEQIVNQFGNVQAANGMTVRQLVDILPDGAAPFTNLQALSDAVAEREAGALRTSIGGVESVTTHLGVSDPSAVSTAPLTSVTSITPDVRTALTNAGITNVGQLAGANPTDVANKLGAAGVHVTPGQIGALTGTAKVLTKLGT